MKIAVYGDSYVDGRRGRDPEYRRDDSHQCWHHLLALKLGADQVDHYGRGGTSFFYTYNQILATHHEYDQIIVAVSEPTRYTKPVVVHGEEYQIPNAAHIDLIPNRAVRENLTGWFLSLDHQFMESAQDCFIRHILSIREQIHLIPCFPESFNRERRYRSGWGSACLLDIAQEARRLGGAPPVKLMTSGIKEMDNILCHFPIDWQEWIADWAFQTVKQRNGSKSLSKALANRTLLYPKQSYFGSY